MSEIITIGNIKVEPGTKKFGHIKAAETPSGSIQLPIMVFNGVKKGPVFSITSAIHGCEVTGPAALARLYKSLNPKDLTGALIAVQVINVPAFDYTTPYFCPIDNLNIGRLWPGNKEGTVSHQLVYTAFKEIVSKGNYWVDLHGGDKGEEHLDVAYFSNTGNKELDKKSEGLARNVLAEWIWQSRPATPGSSVSIAAEKNIPKITYEIGDLACLEEHRIKQCHDGLVNVLRFLGMLPGKVTESKARLLDERMMTRSKHGGLFLPKVKQGDIVSKGQLVGEIMALNGDVVEKIVSPADGVVLQTFPFAAVHSGHHLVGVATFK